MKKIAILLLAAFLVGIVPASAQKKLEKRYAYTLKKLKLNKETEAQFAPVLRAYLTEKKAANEKYDDLKDKYKAAEKAGTLTDSQATQLLDAKFECDAAELVVKKKYYEEFKKILKPKKIFYAFDYASEKLSVIEGRDTDKD